MATKDFRPVPRLGVGHYPPGTQPGAIRPGDFILVHGHSRGSRLIRFGQALRVHGGDRRYCWWSHAALCIDHDGTLIEAIGAGVCQTPLSAYDAHDYHLVRVQANEADRDQMVAFARSCLGHRYGMLINVSIGLNQITGGKLDVGLDGEYICSGLVAKTQERAGAIFDRDSAHITPADLAKTYALDRRRPGRSPS